MHTFTMSSLSTKLSKGLESAWANNSPWLILLLPFSWVFLFIITLRRKLYDWGIFSRRSFETPVIVVGNILAGGTGKTPFVIALVQYLQGKGLKVGVVSRGYRAHCKTFPHEVLAKDPAMLCGDEPLLIKEKTGAWVVIDPDRPRGIEALIQAHKPSLIICDDGLQHYALKPGYTIVIHPREASISPYCFPAGPLREPLSRLKAFDLLVEDLDIQVEDLVLDPSWRYNLITGIARSERVAHRLAEMGLDAEHRVFPDHHQFSLDDFTQVEGPIIMTEKDWIKCKEIIISQPVHVLRVKTVLSPEVKKAIHQFLGIPS